MSDELCDGIGTKFFIGPVTNSNDPSTYAAITGWVEVAEVETIPEFGDQASTITFTSLSSGRVRKRKGARDAGDFVLTCGKVVGDPGQAAMNAAEQTKFRYPIKVVEADAPDEDWSDTTYYFGALVNSARVNVGASNAVNKRMWSILIDTAIHEVEAEQA